MQTLPSSVKTTEHESTTEPCKVPVGVVTLVSVVGHDNTVSLRALFDTCPPIMVKSNAKKRITLIHTLNVPPDSRYTTISKTPLPSPP